MYVLIWLLLALSHISNITTGCKCDKRSCVTPKNCPHGLVWDHCYCCLVCGKGEGELCGGKNYVQGECGDRRQECVVRDSRNYLNRYKNRSDELVGRCEPYSCAFLQCPFGQHCATKDGYPNCNCNISCSGMLTEPVCGEVNNKHYGNECELRKEECKTGRRIGISITPCRGSDIAKISCSNSKMTLTLNRKIFGRRWPRGLALNDPSCKAVVNKTHVTISTLYNGCGTKAKYTLTSIVYSNSLRTLPPKNSLISRRKKVSIPFSCEFLLRRRSRNRISFMPSKSQLSESVELGKYTKKLQDGSYVEVDTTRNYTVVLMTQRYKRLNIKLVPFRCYSTPLARGYGQRRFTLIEKGCPVEENVLIKSSTRSKIVLQVPGIRFKQIRKPGSTIRCRVRLCFLRASGNEDHCRKKCEMNKLKRRKRRETELEVQEGQYSRNNEIDAVLDKTRKGIYLQLPG